jgi:uncharacterized protein DUF6894
VRYYFNIHDGESRFDDEGTEFVDFTEVRAQAIQTTVDLLKDIQGPRFWSGEPWRLWVTDQPQGGGNIFFTLIFSARLSA